MRRRFAGSASRPVSRWPDYYGYLTTYNGVCVRPLLAIVASFVVTPGSWRCSEATGRHVERLAGLMMLRLGHLLLLALHWLKRLWAAAGMLVAAVGLAGTAVLGDRWWNRPRAGTVGLVSGQA